MLVGRTVRPITPGIGPSVFIIFGTLTVTGTSPGVMMLHHAVGTRQRLPEAPPHPR
jgi:hypothetical protein